MLAAVVCMLWVAAPMAFGNEVSSDELAEMRALVEKMQGQLEAQSEQIQHQGSVIREARQEQVEQNERYGASGISAFLQRLEIEGWVAGSYFYNFNSPSEALNGAANTGLSGNVYPFHGNANSFQVDQVWFGIEHPVDEENRAGFRVDLVYGNTACTISTSFGNECPGNNTSELYVNQAYVQYLAPITSNGILVKAGKWGTLAGAEVAQTTANFNITRGNVYNLLQPIDHIGVLFGSDIGESGFSWQAGAANGGSTFAADPDFNSAKAIIGQLAWAGETVGAAATLIWDPSFGGSTQNGLFDIVLTWDPSERLSTWLNFDYNWFDGPGPDADGYGIATAARYAVTDRMGVSTRLEWVRTSGPGWWAGTNGDTDLYGITGTVDYALTTNLMLRGEVRYDHVAKPGNDDEFFDKNGNGLTGNQTTAGVEIVYEF
jgi:hypothetical protein